MTVPDFLPQIRKGTGPTPKDGGCLIQVCSWLNDGHSWTDATPCVHPVLRSAAIRINDSVSDEERQRLLLLAPRLIGTGETGDAEYDKKISVALAVWSARKVLHLARPQDRAGCEAAIEAAEMWIENPNPTTATAYAATTTAAYAATTAAAYVTAAYAAADVGVQAFEGLIGEYERLTGRGVTGVTPVTEAQWASLAEAMR